MTIRHVTVHVTVGEPVTGLWCDACMTSGTCEFPLYWLRESGVSLMGTARRCIVCTPPEDDE